MKTGGDKDDIWTILESGLRYVTARSAPSTDLSLSPFPSVSTIVAHVPYVVDLLIAAMGQSGAIKRAIDFGRGSVLKRLEIGANRKDLFYYLVRQHSICPTRSLH